MKTSLGFKTPPRSSLERTLRGKVGQSTVVLGGGEIGDRITALLAQILGGLTK